MASKKAPEPEVKPTMEEVVSAIEAWHEAFAVAAEARVAEDATKRHLVDVLRRLGLRGFVL